MGGWVDGLMGWWVDEWMEYTTIQCAQLFYSLWNYFWIL